MKRIVPLLLCAALLCGCGENKPRPSGAVVPSGDHLIILQVYGSGDNDNGAVSTGFVELYNPTAQPIALDGLALQYAPRGAAWQPLSLTGSLPAGCSFLIVTPDIVSRQAHYVIPAYDMAWSGLLFDNKGFKLALTDSTAPLTSPNPTRGVIDWVGAGDTDYGEGAPVPGLSKQKAARRVALADSDNNSADFAIIDYRADAISAQRLAEVRPHSLKDGVWHNAEPTLPLTFSKTGGLYNAAFELTLTSDSADGFITYTLDGSEPTAASQRYAQPLAIADRSDQPDVLAPLALDEGVTLPHPQCKGTVVKARAFTADGTPYSGIVTHSYFVGDDMTGRYRLPVVSLSTDAAAFFDKKTGLYENFQQSGAQWQRPVYFEYFDAQGTRQLSQGMGVRIHGNFTRVQAQKSLRLYAKTTDYPATESISYDLFGGAALDSGGAPITDFRHVILRSSGNDNNSTMLRDSLIQSLLGGLHTDRQASQPCVLFLNGEFWGLYNLRERYDNDYFASHYHINKNQVALLSFNLDCDNVPELQEGAQSDLDYYNETYDFFNSTDSFAAPADYARAQTYLDTDSLIDFFIAHIYANDSDWPGNNNVMWRYRTPKGYDADAPAYQDGRWRWVIKDMDFGFGYYDVDYRLLYRVLSPGSQRQASWGTLFFRKLLTNPAFKSDFINRFCTLLATNFAPSTVQRAIAEQRDAVSAVMDEQIARYGQIADLPTWQTNVKALQAFADAQPDSLLAQLQQVFTLSPPTSLTLENDGSQGALTLNGTPLPSASRWQGRYFADTTQTLLATPRDGYVFDRFVATTDAGSATVYANPAQFTVAAGGLTVQAVYRADTQPASARPTLTIDGVDTLVAGEQRRYTATDAKGNALPVKWAVSDSAATIDTDGHLTAHAAGTLTIIATAADGRSADKRVTLRPAIVGNNVFVTTHGQGDVTSTANGTATTYRFAPAAGYRLVAVRHNGLTRPTETQYTVNDVTQPATLAVVFARTDGSDTPHFSDIATHPQRDAIAALAAQGVVGQPGLTAFAPDRPADRATAVTMLAQLYGADLSVYTGTRFTDVPPFDDADNWYGRAVAWSQDRNLTVDNRLSFAPQQPLSRLTLAVFLYRLAENIDADVSADADLTAYPDANSVEPWAAKELSWCLANELLTPRDGALALSGSVSRAELAAALYRFTSRVGG